MEMTEWRYQELNLCQLFDILRSERIARLAVICDDAPYITPMYFQWQLEGDDSILHFSCAAHGKRYDCLQTCPYVAVEIECASCTGMDVLLAEGVATMSASEEFDAAWIQVRVLRMTGRRYFMP